MKSIFGLIILGLLVLTLWKAVPERPEAPNKELKQEAVTIHTQTSDATYTVEVAQTPEQMETGLMYRTEMAANHGMLFLWPEDGQHDMWMKNTSLPLDMLFIDSHGKIVHVATDTVPGSLDGISAGQPTRAVIELMQGQAKAHGIHVGDQVISEHFVP